MVKDCLSFHSIFNIFDPTIAININNKGIIAMFTPFKKDLTFLFSISDLSISLIARKIINDITAIMLKKVINSEIVTVVIVVVTVDIMI